VCVKESEGQRERDLSRQTAQKEQEWWVAVASKVAREREGDQKFIYI